MQNDVYKQGYLDLNNDNLWEFFTHNVDSNIVPCLDLYDIQYAWKIKKKTRENVWYWLEA